MKSLVFFTWWRSSQCLITIYHWLLPCFKNHLARRKTLLLRNEAPRFSARFWKGFFQRLLAPFNNVVYCESQRRCIETHRLRPTRSMPTR